MTASRARLFPVVLLFGLGCTNARTCPSSEDPDYREELCGPCGERCIAAVAETPIEQAGFWAQVCVLRLNEGAPTEPTCCASNYSSPLCQRPQLSECTGDAVLERYDVYLDRQDACAPVEFSLPILDDSRTNGRPVLVVLTVTARQIDYCAVLDLRGSMRDKDDIVTIQGNALPAAPGFEPPRPCPNAVDGPALNDPPPDGGM